MRILAPLLVALAATAPLAPEQAQSQSQAEAAKPDAVIKLLPWRNRWVMEAEIGGKLRKFLLDTAGGLTLVSPETAQAVGCAPYGQLTGYNMMAQQHKFPRCRGVSMRLGGVTLTPPVLGLIDMGKNNPKDAGLDGLIALNLFDGRTVTFDFAAGIVTLESAASRAQRTATMRPLPIRLSREVSGTALAALAEIPTPQGPLLMELDSGNGGTVLVSNAVAALVGMDPANEGKQHADFPVLGDIRATSDDAFAPDMIIEGNLGMPFLRNWVITLDLARGLAWIGAPPVPPRPAAALPATPN